MKKPQLRETTTRHPDGLAGKSRLDHYLLWVLAALAFAIIAAAAVILWRG